MTVLNEHNEKIEKLTFCEPSLFCDITIIFFLQKRQLFREHLLPHQGGKIPDSAFVPERISLNRLNQNGFYTLDGVVLEQKSPDVHHTAKKYPPPTIKVRPMDLRFQFGPFSPFRVRVREKVPLPV